MAAPDHANMEVRLRPTPPAVKAPPVAPAVCTRCGLVLVGGDDCPQCDRYAQNATPRDAGAPLAYAIVLGAAWCLVVLAVLLATRL
jgi:hypothetical protein